mmetsp:Transcript_1780/g.2147  ORF Transcript_1780/g.2147 Transcript_1780/m.2147 type:complete len:222 (+) Transcript_1780:241-906(+)
MVLGLVHAEWKSVPGRFKYYIATSKENRCKSLHTTVIGPDGRRMEVKIRTHPMHEIAGIAAHWVYKENINTGAAGKEQQHKNSGISREAILEEARRFQWLRELVESVQQVNDPTEFLSTIKADLYTDKEVMVFSPTGQLFSLSQGSSVLDYAYRLHSDLGHSCTGGKVNGKMVPMKQVLESGDTVEILKRADRNANGWIFVKRGMRFGLISRMSSVGRASF